MISKKLWLLTLIFVAIGVVPSALAVVEVTYNFNVPNVQVEAFDCLNSECSQVGQFSGSFPEGKSTSSGRLAIRFPSTLATQYGYALYYFSKGFKPMIYRATWHSFGNPSLLKTSFSISFSKVSVCRAVVDQMVVTNELYPNRPLVVSMLAGLDATTRSAFFLTDRPVEYIPPAYLQEHFGADTRVTLTIKDGSGNVVNQQAKSFTAAQGNSILADQSVRVEFSWTPSSEGTYTASIVSEVIDDQCASSEPMASSKAFTVLPSLPSNQCYTILNNLALSNPRPLKGETVTASFDKISNYAQSTNSLIPVQTSVRYVVTGPKGTLMDTQALLGANPTPNAETFSFSFTPQEQGLYSVTLTGISSDSRCNSVENIPDTITTSFFAAQEPSLSVHFQVKDASSGMAVSGATITLSNGRTASTGPNGEATIAGLSPGTYDYWISKAGYITLTGTFTLTDADKTIFVVLQPGEQGSFTATFVVRDAITSQPIPEAVIALNTGQIAITNQQGTASITGLAPGTYWLFVSKQGYVSVSSSFTIANSDVLVSIALVPLGQAPPSLPSPTEKEETFARLRIDSIAIPNQFELEPGSDLELIVTFENSGARLESASIVAAIAELGIRVKQGPFELTNGDRKTKRLILTIPEDAEPGSYWVRITLGQDSQKRTVHREVEITVR